MICPNRAHRDRESLVGITETPEVRLSRDGLAMNHHRYRFAGEYCAGRDVLELACGAGQGLGHLAARARSLVGGDLVTSLLRRARQHYRQRVPLVCLDAEALAFGDASFDVVVLLEAIYYLPHPRRFLNECRRVLRPGGRIVIGSVNPRWKDFHPSPCSQRYFSAAEIRELLASTGFEPRVYGAFPDDGAGLRASLTSWIRRAAASLRLIPRTMKGKEILKRVFYGKLRPLPPELDVSGADYVPPEALEAMGEAPLFKILYAVGSLPGEAAP